MGVPQYLQRRGPEVTDPSAKSLQAGNQHLQIIHCKCMKIPTKKPSGQAQCPAAAGLGDVNTAPVNTIFRKTTQQKTSSEPSPPERSQAWSTTTLLSKSNHLYHSQPSHPNQHVTGWFPTGLCQEGGNQTLPTMCRQLTC